MKGLKVVVLVLAVLSFCLFLCVIILWGIRFTFVGRMPPVDVSGSLELVKFVLQVISAVFILSALLSMMLMFNSRKYLRIVSLGGYSLLAVGMVAAVWGIYYDFPAWIWIFTVLFCVVFGGLTLYLKRYAVPKSEQPAE